MKLLSAILLACMAGSAQAAVIEYAAPLDQSSWRLAQDTPIECRLEHEIPAWGKGTFVSRAGKGINLDFELAPYRQQARTQTVSLRSTPPMWRPGLPEQNITNIRFYKQFDGLVDGQAAWSMLDELERGRFPSFQYGDWYHQGRNVRVSVSSVGFHARYQSFLQCMQNLLPYTFEDIAFTVLTYQKNSNQLTPYSRRRLEMISEYVKADQNIDMVLVDAYTDSYGGRWPNQKLSERRAEAIKDHFADLGVDPTRIQVQGHGEKQHVATNATETGRGTNRRVVISMERFLPPI